MNHCIILPSLSFTLLVRVGLGLEIASRFTHRVYSVALRNFCFSAMSLLDAEFGAKSSRKKPKQVSEEELKQKVRQCIRDNCKEMSHDQIYNDKNEENMTFYQCVYERKKLWCTDNKKYPCGGVWFAKTKNEFVKAVALKGVTLSSPATVINPMLLNAMIKFKQTGARGPVAAVLQILELVSQKDLVGIITFALTLKPCTSEKSLDECLDVMRCLSRLDVHTKYPQETQVLHAWMDQVVLQVHSKSKGESAKPSNFIATNKKFLRLVMPMELVEQLLAVKGSWEGFGDQLAAVAKSSLIGKLLFGQACSGIMGTVLKNLINEMIDNAFKEQKSVTLDFIESLSRQIVEAWETKSKNHKLADSRLIVVLYRLMQVPDLQVVPNRV